MIIVESAQYFSIQKAGNKVSCAAIPAPSQDCVTASAAQRRGRVVSPLAQAQLYTEKSAVALCGSIEMLSELIDVIKRLYRMTRFSLVRIK